MRPALSRAALLAAPLLLAACAVAPQAPAPRAVAPLPPRMPDAGLGQVVGADMAGLIRLFGPAALDVREGNARKLQFRGAACVLDAYLYPPVAGGAPRVTWLDSRTPLGLPFDKASCVAALTRAR